MGVDSSHVLQQIVIEEHGSSPNGKGIIEVPSPASVFRPDNMSDIWSRSSSQPTDESASSSTPGNLIQNHLLSSSNALSVSGEHQLTKPVTSRADKGICQRILQTGLSGCTDHLCVSSSVLWYPQSSVSLIKICTESLLVQDASNVQSLKTVP